MIYMIETLNMDKTLYVYWRATWKYTDWTNHTT